jgi:hypothetical protein
MTPEEYKEEQKLRIANYKVGEKEANGYTITKVFGRGDEYVVYEIDTKDLVDSLKVWIDTKVEEDKVPINHYNAVRAKFSEVKGLLYKVVDKTTIKTIISHILINAITGNPDKANTQFDDLVLQINKEYKEQFDNRLRLLISALLFSALLIGIAIFTYFNGCLKQHLHIRNLIFITAGGSVGGFFSISIGVNKIVTEKDVSVWLYILYGIERIVVAIMASTIVYFAIQADFVFSVCKKMENPLIGYVTFSILAGFSETLVPNLLTKLEKEE